MSLADYDPRYLELWRDGSVKPVRVPQKNRQAAIVMRHRLYRCRKEMVKADHPYAEMAGKVSISVIGVDPAGVEHKFSTIQRLPCPEGKLKWLLLLDNADAVFDEALSDAGYGVPEAPTLDD